MPRCRHLNLAAVADSTERLRCRNCHLTIRADELENGFCPECYENSGQKQYDFDRYVPGKPGVFQYRCEDCGAMLSPYSR